MSNLRTELHREIVEELIASKAIDFDSVGNTLAKYGAKAAISGSAIGAVINWRVIDLCIPPDPLVSVIDKSIAASQTQN